MTKKREGMTYAGSGVGYDQMDPFKLACQIAGRETAKNLQRFDFKEAEGTRGESVYLIDLGDGYLAQVEEGLGTKNLAADIMYELSDKTGATYYNQIAQDTVAMIVNDMITSGALPLSVAMHLAVGDSRWFEDQKRYSDLIEGWKNACNLANCAWGGGETPTLKDIIFPGAVVLSGSAIGMIDERWKKIEGKVRVGDSIILVESSGIGANGLTLARELATKLPASYLTKLSDGRTYGESLLDPTHIYVRMIEKLINDGIKIHRAENITGHGWRKIMRANQSLAYVIEKLPKQLPIFDFIQQEGPVSDEEAYGTFNMGAGFALFVSKNQAKKTVEIINENCSFSSFVAGYVEESEEKKVIIKPKDLTFLGGTLKIKS